MSLTDFEQKVLDHWGHECVICTRRPEEWLEASETNHTQEKLSRHHVNGDKTDDRVENVIPVCQSCHIHIHRCDKPPYRVWHRQLPIEDRNAWNEHYHEYYEGPRLTREEAEAQFGDEGGIPVSIKYLKQERDDFDHSIFIPADEAEPGHEAETRETTDAGDESNPATIDDAITDGGNERDELTDDDVGTNADAATPADETGGESDD